ncbi:hypothetical protein [Methylovulum miyakonense]|uniref:hypothetical protein n=1 Tax=Methylovulum miyakonense TaxID=645578 RepID=UPI0003798CE6|nr:hypothetical protein [Methylovulum miyakonense]
MAKVTFTQGRRQFQQNNLLSASAKQSLSQKVKQSIKAYGIDESRLDKLAKEKRTEVVNTAIGFFSAAVNGAVELVNNSTVPAQYQEPPLVPGRKAFARKHKVQARGAYNRGTVSVSVVHKISVLSKSTKGSSNVLISFPVTWKKLTKRYFMRLPRSARFFKKRTENKSARLAFNSVAASWQRRLRSTASYQKGKMTWKHDGYDLVTTFTINYPSLGQFDFIRVAFLHGLKRTSTFPNGRPDNTGANGIVYAEHFRPLVRPYAVEVGRQFKRALEKLD